MDVDFNLSLSLVLAYSQYSHNYRQIKVDFGDSVFCTLNRKLCVTYLVSQLLSLDLEVRGFFLYVLEESYIERGHVSLFFIRTRSLWF
jgi:hypothetical protein